MTDLVPLALAALLWLGLHVGVSGTGLRGLLVARIGAKGFRIAFSLGSLVTIVLLVLAWRAAPTTPMWPTPGWLRWLLALAMLPALMLFVGSVTTPNPPVVGGERAIGVPPRGVVRITRHPMLWSFAIWAAVHMLGNGDAASLLFFGTFLVTALAGMPSIDAKVAARDPAAWEPFAAATSILPFAAIAAGRNMLPSLAELGRVVPAVGVLVWLLLLGAHPHIIGVPVLPG